jgi:hypothetical protein
VQVLERGHASDVEEGMRATVRSALEQLDSQKGKMRASAQQWLQDLADLATGKLAANVDGGNVDGRAEALPAVAGPLQERLSGQLPPEWRGGFLRFEWRPALAKPAAAPILLVAGDERMANAETPARLEPAVFMQWGVLMFGVRAELDRQGSRFVLTAGRPLDANVLGALAPGHDVMLTDVRGYPIVASAGRPEAELRLRAALDPDLMLQRERALARGVEGAAEQLMAAGAQVRGVLANAEGALDRAAPPVAAKVTARPRTPSPRSATHDAEVVDAEVIDFGVGGSRRP